MSSSPKMDEYYRSQKYMERQLLMEEMKPKPNRKQRRAMKARKK